MVEHGTQEKEEDKAKEEEPRVLESGVKGIACLTDESKQRIAHRRSSRGGGGRGGGGGGRRRRRERKGTNRRRNAGLLYDLPVELLEIQRLGFLGNCRV